MEENEYREKKETAFSSPIPFLLHLKKFIFGEDAPSLLLRVPIYINLIIWLIFQLWHIISYFAIAYRDVILKEKKINVEILITQRGEELGFEANVFLDHLLKYHSISIFCWLTVFIGIALMWRKIKRFTWFIFVPLAIILLMVLFYMGFDYMYYDIPFFDKISFLIFLLSSAFYLLMLNREEGDESNFFMDKQED